jgi:hypothetical protein
MGSWPYFAGRLAALAVLVLSAFAIMVIAIVIVIMISIVIAAVMAMVIAIVLMATAGNAIQDHLRGAMKGIENLLGACDKQCRTGWVGLAKLRVGFVLEVLQILHSDVERALVKRAGSGFQDHKERRLINIAF